MMTTMTVTSLAEFLLARITEDENTANRAKADLAYELRAGHLEAEYELLGYYEPDRVLAECDAKRRIAELVEEGLDHWSYACDTVAYEHKCLTCQLRALLALPYADHPDYQQEWKPA